MICRRDFFRKIMQAVPLFTVPALEAGSNISKRMAINSISSLQADDLNPGHGGEDTVLTAEVTVTEVEHYYFPNGSRYMQNGEWFSRDSSQVNVYCMADSYADDFELELYFDAHGKEWVSSVLHDLTEGSRWVVSGNLAILDSGITLLGPGYKKSDSNEWVKTPVSRGG